MRINSKLELLHCINILEGLGFDTNPFKQCNIEKTFVYNNNVSKFDILLSLQKCGTINFLNISFMKGNTCFKEFVISNVKNEVT